MWVKMSSAEQDLPKSATAPVEFPATDWPVSSTLSVVTLCLAGKASFLNRQCLHKDVGMKLLMIIVSGWGVVVSGAYAQAAEDGSTYRDNRIEVYKQLEKPLTHWLSEMASVDQNRKKQAITVLEEVAVIVSLADYELIANPADILAVPRYTGDDIPGPDQRLALANRYRRELREALPAMIRQLSELISAKDSESYAEAVETLAACITVTFPDGSGLVRARRQLPRSMKSDQLIILLFRYTALTLPADKTLHAIVIPEIQNLSEETTTWLRSEWDRVKDKPRSEKPLIQFSLGLASMVLMSGISHRNRIFEEMPIFTETLKPEYPQLIRCASLACLGEYSFFAESALPDVRRLLTDDSHLIRDLSARVVAVIALDEGELSELADIAGLEGAERQEFIADCSNEIDDNFGDGTLSWIEDLIRDEREESKGVIQLKSTKLHVLRCVRHSRSRAKHLEPFVRECLHDQDDSIRKSAELAMTAIQLPAPAPQRDR